MSKLSQEIDEALTRANDLLRGALASEDTRVLVRAVLTAHTLVVSADKMCQRMSDGIYRRGVESLIRQADEQVTTTLCRAISGE